MLEFDSSFLESNNSVLHFGNCFPERINSGNSFLERHGMNSGNSFLKVSILEILFWNVSFPEILFWNESILFWNQNFFIWNVSILENFVWNVSILENFILDVSIIFWILKFFFSLERTNSILAFIHVFVGRHNFNL